MGERSSSMTHLQTQVFILLLRQQTEDDACGGTRSKPDLDSGVSRGQGPQELELNVAPSVEGELWSHLSNENRDFNTRGCHNEGVLFCQS